MNHIIVAVNSVLSRIVIDTDDLSKKDAQMIFTIFWVVFGFALVVIIAMVVKNRKKDNRKPLCSVNGTVIEKTAPQVGVEWCIIESESGQRIRLRNLHSNELLLSVGDKGTVDYRGDTIQYFSRGKKANTVQENASPVQQWDKTVKWKCSECGNTNSGVVTKCVNCGNSRSKEVELSTPKESLSVGEWRCPTCGRINQNYVGTCGCGTVKPR